MPTTSSTSKMNFPWPFNRGKTGNNVASDDTPADSTLSSRPALTREQEADAELDQWLREINGEEPKVKTVVAPSPAIGGIAPPINNAPKEEEKPDYTPRQYSDGTIDIRPDVMHPRSMNCRQQFDQAFYCQSLGGKFNDIYRYGHFKDCSENWGAFWFCMRNRTLGEDEKARQTMEYYRERDAKRRKEHGSSEDVWDIRERSVQKAFWKDPDQAGKEEAVKE